jgi:tetratricopeptide (TPR) repeat protein
MQDSKQTPMDIEEAAAALLLSMDDNSLSGQWRLSELDDEAGALGLPGGAESLELDTFKRELGSAPMKKFNSEGGLAPTHDNYWNTVGVLHYRDNNWGKSIEALEKSMSLCKGGDCADWFFVAMARWQLGNKDEARKWYRKAVEWMEKNNSKDEELRRFRAEAAQLLEPPEPPSGKNAK